MIEEVKKVIEKEIKPLLAMEGGGIELIGVDDGLVKVRLQGACASCCSSQYTLVYTVEARLKDRIPEVKGVVAV
ncbi:MAG: NifU family protein [Methanophagales archaeon]|nr:NifU family protein [Methanophagales archaeon]